MDDRIKISVKVSPFMFYKNDYNNYCNYSYNYENSKSYDFTIIIIITVLKYPYILWTMTCCDLLPFKRSFYLLFKIYFTIRNLSLFPRILCKTVKIN